MISPLSSCDAARAGPGIEAGDIIVVTQKIVSKAEGRVVPLADVTPSPEAERLAVETEKDARLVELILRESNRIVRQSGPILITETKHGFVCANAGIDASNVGPEGLVSLLPEDPDRSAAAIRTAHSLSAAARRWPSSLRTPSVAPGAKDTRTSPSVWPACFPSWITSARRDPDGYELRVSTLAVADELAAAAELVHGKLDRVPVAIIRGYAYPRGEGSARELVRDAERDLFR